MTRNPIDQLEEQALSIRALRWITVALAAVLLSVWAIQVFKVIDRVRTTVEKVGTTVEAQ